MEALGVAASIIQVLDVALRTTEALVQYANDAKNASMERKVLAEETICLAAILRSLRDRVNKNALEPAWLESRKDLVRQFQRAYQDLAACLQLDILTGRQKTETRFQAIRAAAKWSFSKSEVYALVERITRLQQYANTLMVNEQGILLETMVQTQQKETERNLKEAVTKWLSPLQMNRFQQSIAEQAQVGSGRWFLTSEKFLDWQIGNSNLLWCPGLRSYILSAVDMALELIHALAGAGKTVITSLVVNYLRRQVRQSSVGVGVGIGFIYFKYNSPEQTLCNVLASILVQLAQGQPNLPDHLRDLYQRCQDINIAPSLTDLSEALPISIEAFSEVYFVLDALDECSDEVRWGTVGRLRELSESQPKVRILILSRFLGDIGEELKEFERLEIKAHQDDIELFIDGQIQKSPNLRRAVEKSHSLRGDIKEAVLRTAKDMFLLARLHVDSLISAAALSIKHVRKKLNTLPTTLAATYDEAIRRITNQDPDHKDIAFKTLAWVSYTFRPLRLKELQHALAIEPGVEELDEEMVLDEQSITALCAGLVVIDTGTDAVNLVHYTTKSYLEDKRQVFFPGFHGQITMNCAAYLMISPLRKATIWEIVHNYPLACYAAQYMGDHARHNPEEALEQSILDAVYQLLAQRHSRKPLLCLLDGLDLIRSGFYSSNNPLLPMDNIGDEGTDDEPGKVGAEPAKGLSNQILEVTSLHLAASMGLARVAAMLLKETTDIDAMDETGKTALAVAIEKGFEKAVEFLVYSGACVDLHTDHGRGVFLLLIEKSWHAVADIVCAKAKSSAPEKAADVHLLFAAYSGKADELGRIIQRDPSVSEDAKLMELALFVAVECTRPAIIELLLSDYVDVNCKDNTGQTSLHRATRRGSESIVEILLKHGADIDSVNDEGLTAWSSNLSSKNERILGILLAAGTDPNTKGPNGVSQLYSAAASGQIEIVKLMLKSGTNPSIKTDFSWAPLHWASYNGHIECVKLLINAGADPNPVSDQETTPLDLALRANQTAVIVILLGAGGQEAIHLAENDLGSASGFDSTKSLSLLSKTASSITLAEADEAGAPAKMAFAFDQPLEQSTSFGQFIYPIHHRSGCRDVHDFSGLNNQPYQISHMLDNRAHSISVRRAKFRPLMSEYPLKEDLFVREGVLYDIAPVTMDYQDLELHGDAENAISGPITMRKSWSGSWKAHHVDKGSTKLLFRSIPDWTVTNKPGSRWVREDGYLIARIGGALETTLIVEERLDSKLLDALVACWVAKTWSETLTTHKGKWH